MKYLNYILGIIIVIIILVVMILIYNDKITQNSPLYYKQGIAFYNNGDYQNAYYNFGKIKWISPLYHMALYRQAKSAQKVGDYNTAVLKYEMFLSKSPNSIFIKNAKINLAKCYFYLKRYDEAKLQFEDLNIKNGDYLPQKEYYLGLIEKNYNKEKAESYFSKYLDKALNDKTVTKDYLIPAADELSNLGVNLSEKEIKNMALAYFKGGKYEQALSLFSKLPADDVWDYIVLTNHYCGNKLIAKKLIETGLISHSKATEEENLHAIYNIFTSYMNSSKTQNWLKMYNLAKENSLKGEDYIMYKTANLLSKEKSVPLYEELIKKYPESNYVPESMWNLFWYNYTKQNYEKAKEIGLNHIKLFTNAKSTPKIMFWLAKIYSKENKNQEAHTLYSKLSTKFSDDYYGLRAQSILDKKEDFFITDKNLRISEKNYDIDFPLSLSEMDIKDLKLINSLFAMGDYEIWSDADFNNKIADSWFEYRKGNKSRSIVLARDYINETELKPPFASESYKLMYPIYYIDEINIAGKKLNIDSFLILSLIREESHFNENAKSSVNATGLMQLMPDTANYIISKLSIDVFEKPELENPKLNLFLGCNYLKYLYDRFSNTGNNKDIYVIAAYNGGEGSVKRWIKNFNTQDSDEFIERIPFEETRHYVKKVFKTYNMYKKIYD